ncbi:STM3941 family protein [Bradyrhizobium sp. ORS 285]|uniref:STM3941 family protein n=1 Tax=Bradyrhizobium sp. ORS 285 TaxID=115808 RepID=UPI001111EBC8|nr:STM3941 family protein [Bradyrhizobium sp. ORS 285]
MTIDTNGEFKVEASPLKLLRAALIGAVVSAICIGVALGWFDNVQPGSFREFVCYVGAVFFPLLTLRALWRAFATPGPVLILSREGIQDLRLAAELIPWDAIQDIAVRGAGRSRSIMLSIDPAVETKLTFNTILRWTRTADRAFGMNGLSVRAGDLKIGFDELLAATLAFARAGQSHDAASRRFSAFQAIR